MEITANVSGGANISIAAPSLKIEAPKITMPSIKIEVPKITMPSMNLNIAAPKVSVGGNIGMNASAGVGMGGNASVSIAAPKITMPSMNVRVATPSVNMSVGVSTAPMCDIGHSLSKYN